MVEMANFITPSGQTHRFRRLEAPAKTITVALAGNPNSGKTTIFNNLTGTQQRVGNYGGVTVETKLGSFRYGQYLVKVVDLPGTYSLSAYSVEEIVARDYIIQEKPDVIVDIVDGSNLQRNLYLAVQLKEMNLPLVVVLNMSDELRNKGLHVNLKGLSRDLAAPIVATIGTRKKGMKRLVERIIEMAQGNWVKPETPPISYGQEIEEELEKIEQAINQHTAGAGREYCDDETCLCRRISARWVGLKLLENDIEILKNLKGSDVCAEIAEQVNISRKRITSILGEEPEVIIAEQRYGYVHGVYRTVVRRSAEARINISDKFDKVLTNRLLGIPIFAGLMYLTFWLVFTAGAIPMGWIESAIGILTEIVGQLWPAGTAELLRSLVIDGIIAGVGNVIVFLPNIMLLFLAISLLEDTGYMARAAFIMDRLMKWVGLHGKSFIPMLTGFGCSVPAVMGTRILENRADRITTILVLPLMSCGARLPIYLLIIPAFFSPDQSAAVMYAIYIIGIVTAIIAARLLRSTLFKSSPSPFVMELPPYRIPTLRAVLLHMWQRSRLYLRKAGTLILGISIIMWALTSYPKISAEKLTDIPAEEVGQAQVEYSFASRIGKAIEPALAPMGFDWKIGSALIGAFAAKEVFVAQLGIVYSVEQQQNATTKDEENQLDTLRRHLKVNYTPLVGFCIMLFSLIACPCMATVAVTRRETGSWKWALLQFGGLTAVAYVLTIAVYQVGKILQIGI